MARYTMELWEVLETGVNLFDFDYDFYDPTKKQELQNNFLEHFKYYEIGSETIERFKWRLKRKWLETIGEYSDLFKASERIGGEIDILSNNQLRTKTTRHDSPIGEETFDDNHLSDYEITEQTGYTGTTGMELMRSYCDNYFDVENEYFDEFNSLFMQVF